MKSIKGKLVSIFILILSAMLIIIGSSYVAVDTQKQHLVLTELLSKQKLLVERVTFTALNSSEIALYNPDRFLSIKDESRVSVEGYIEAVDFMLNAFTIRTYPLDGTDVKLKFNKDFSLIFDEALEQSKVSWESAKENIDWLLDESNIEDVEAYKNKLSEFKSTNLELIDASDYITHICRVEANRKKKLSETIQLTSFGIAGIIFVLLIFIIKRDIQSPIMDIRRVFKKMGNGDFDVKLTRNKDDEFKSLYNDFNRFIDNYGIIKNIENHILEEDGLGRILNYMKETFNDFIPIERISIYYKNTSEGAMKYSTDQKQSIKIEDYQKYDGLKKVNNTTLVVPIIVNGINIGYTEFVTISELSDRNIVFIQGLKEKIGFALYKTLLFKDLLGIVTTALSDLAEQRDPETKKHLTRMSYYSKIIAEEMQTTEKYKEVIDDYFIENILLTAPMHDIGKVSVPDHILLKPGKLTDEEYNIMKTHAFNGAIVLKKIHENFNSYGLDYFEMAEHIANYHQEKFDGSGYPDKIMGDNIPIAARISALADVFDALTSKRPYKDAFSLEKSYGIIKESSGKHFDPDVVKAFFAVQEKIEAIYERNKEI